MERQTVRIVSMLVQLLDLARITSGKIQLARNPVDLALAVQGAVETTAPLIERRNHHFSLSLPDEAPGSVLVEGDAIRLAQVVENLLSNAAKYTDMGGIIDLTLEVDEKWARIRVRDSGIGMEADLLPHIFELFIQGPRDLERAAGGLGLGLPLVKSLVEMHGGKIDASSPGRGQGSEVIVTLPRMREASAKKRANGEGSARQTAAERRYRILLVDDETEMVTILAELLERAGHQTCTVHDGLAALDAAGSFAPEIILLDLGLPGIDGYEVARRLREQPRGEAPLMVAVTGYQADAERLGQAGFDHHLLKPLSMGKLYDLLAAEGGRAHGEARAQAAAPVVA
jgi:CheY-like chemotaxis protein